MLLFTVRVGLLTSAQLQNSLIDVFRGPTPVTLDQIVRVIVFSWTTAEMSEGDVTGHEEQVPHMVLSHTLANARWHSEWLFCARR